MFCDITLMSLSYVWNCDPGTHMRCIRFSTENRVWHSPLVTMDTPLSGSCRCKARVRGWRGESKGREEGRSWPRRRAGQRRPSPSPAIAGRGTHRTRRRRIRKIGVRRGGGKEWELGFSGAWGGGFVPARRPGDRRIKPGDDGRLSASSGSWWLAGQIRPRRAWGAGRFGGRPLAMWRPVAGCFLL
jgi:hypothetical protein